ncbi:hypothetical protein GCM10023149_25620 [Mucilaginibacter gynuensis]|uniref:Uncharacterized protein n=1 Tax=Mucilaginibacter gynuensis TaxID=1302236 RepID=A0ABP8GH05_9SPHI
MNAPNDNAFLSLQFARSVVMPLPGVTEKICFDTPAFYANKKIFSRLKEDGLSWVMYTEERDKWMQADPETFFITDHYVNYNYMLVNLATVNPADLQLLLITAWKNRALKKQVETALAQGLINE